MTKFRVGATTGRRVWRPEHYRRIDLGLRVPPLATPISRIIAGLDVVLDLSGGDSFADLYGAARFNHVMRPKLLAKRLGKRLILLPQTYGPFDDEAHRKAACDAALYAEKLWARDGVSYRRLQEMLGDGFDAGRHGLGVDMALGMTPQAPSFDNPPAWLSWLDDRNKQPCIGLNISGLVANYPAQARREFGLSLDYRAVVEQLIRYALEMLDCRLLLIPHVVTDPATAESDIRACRDFYHALSPDHQARVAVTDAITDARELKWLISRLAWFCGTRLHATIAGLSSSVPTATLAYSLKAEGIFADFASSAHCVDMRRLDHDAALARVIDSLNGRDRHRPVLAAAAAAMQQRWADQALTLQDLIHKPTQAKVA